MEHERSLSPPNRGIHEDLNAVTDKLAVEVRHVHSSFD